MELTAAWVAFPLVLAALCVGSGLLVERLAGRALPDPLIPPLGCAAVIVVSQLSTLSEGTAELSAPLTGGLALAGFGLRIRPATRRFDSWAIRAALGAFAVYAAPIVLSGEATLAGYMSLDDSATWMALTDRVMEHGHSLAGLAPSTYEATLSFTLGKGYPVGALLPLGIGAGLLRQDVAWLIAPYMATLGAMLALTLWELARPLVDSRRIRALLAIGAAQPALLYGYYLWGGVKEMLVAVLVASGCAIAARSVGWGARRAVVVPLLVLALAAMDSLSSVGAVWMLPALGFAAWVSWPAAKRRLRPGTLALALLAATLAVPAFAMAGFISPTRAAFTSGTELGNLLGPLSAAQVLGIWPAGDFRLDPDLPYLAAALMVVAVAGAIGGAAVAVRRDTPGPLLYLIGTLAVAGVTWAIGSPWLGAKALAIASPAPLLAALGFAGRLAESRRLLAATAVATAVGGGVLWSNALAYRDVSLAPRAQLAELEAIGHRIAGEGPTLMTEYEPYGARHFLREADPEGASELRRRRVPLVSGELLEKGDFADTDRLRLGGLVTYRTLVLRRSPAQSRPPSPYRLTWGGDYYEVWQRPAGSRWDVLAHLGLGSRTEPGGVPRCADVRRLARKAGPNGALAAVPRARTHVYPPRELAHPPGWGAGAYAGKLVPATPGALETRVSLARPGVYGIWLGGSVRPQVDVLVDGEPVGSVRNQLNNRGDYVLLAEMRLTRGTHRMAIRFHAPDLHPGSGGEPYPIGPLALSRQDAGDTRVARFLRANALRLCGRRWDWIEALPSGARGV